MRIHRFYIEKIPESNIVYLESGEFRHLKVLRINKGDKIEIFDGKKSYKAEVLEIFKNRAKIKKLEKIAKPELKTQIFILTTMPKRARADWLVEKACELGATAITPLITERTVVIPKKGKLERWKRIVIEAAKQCGRVSITKIEEPKKLENINFENYDLKLLCAKDGLKPEEIKEKGEKIALAIGPEGGFTKLEEDFLIEKGFIKMRLAAFDLRTETAALAALTVVSLKYG